MKNDANHNIMHIVIASLKRILVAVVADILRILDIVTKI